MENQRKLELTAVEMLHKEQKELFKDMLVDVQKMLIYCDKLQDCKDIEQKQKDDFAISFAEWLANSNYSYNFGIKMYQHKNKEIYKTTHELLLIYKQTL